MIGTSIHNIFHNLRGFPHGYLRPSMNVDMSITCGVGRCPEI
jgi:hypothetical protein